MKTKRKASLEVQRLRYVLRQMTEASSALLQVDRSTLNRASCAYARSIERLGELLPQAQTILRIHPKEDA